jgi:DNA-binding FadR family transcriptional regulator
LDLEMTRLHRGPLEELIADIVSGELEPDQALPREADLAEQFNISRGTAREVIRALEERGLIRVKHGRGATVNSEDRWDTLDPAVLAALLAGPRSAEILGEFLESRRIIEIEAAGLAASRAEKGDVARMTEAYDAMEEAAEAATRGAAGERRFHEADVSFHRAVFQGTKNSTLVALASSIHGAMLEARYPLARPQLRAARTLPEHKRILDAIGKGDAAAARRAMKKHLDSVGEFLAEYAGERDGEPALAGAGSGQKKARRGRVS